MAKKNGGFGKLIAFTTAVAAIGGVCYIFRDKIKDSSLFKSASGKAGDIYDSVKSKMNKDDDLFFDDWDDDFEDYDDEIADVNSDNTVSREYTSISSVQNDSKEDDTFFNEVDSTDNADSDDTSESIPTIDFNRPSAISSSESQPEAYENEGLSDTSEDPDVLEDQDKLDF